MGSTIIGQGVNTSLFYVLALSGILPSKLLLTAILSGWLLKVLVEVVCLPLTIAAVNWLKGVEGVEIFDINTDFSPFRA